MSSGLAGPAQRPARKDKTCSTLTLSPDWHMWCPMTKGENDKFTLADLKTSTGKRLTRRKETYAYARSKGFSAEESNILAQRSRDTITD